MENLTVLNPFVVGRYVSDKYIWESCEGLLSYYDNVNR